MKKILSLLSLAIIFSPLFSINSTFAARYYSEPRPDSSKYHSDDYCYYHDCYKNDYDYSRERNNHPQTSSSTYQQGYRNGFSDGYSLGYKKGYHNGYYSGYHEYPYNPSPTRPAQQSTSFKRADYYRSNYTDYCYDYYQHRYQPCRDIYLNYYRD
jgi:hypothetical protein